MATYFRLYNCKLLKEIGRQTFWENSRPQYAVFYSAGKQVSVINAEATFHDAATKEVNNNQEMLNNISMYKKLND